MLSLFFFFQQLPTIPPEYHWIPNAAFSFLGTLFLTVLGALYRSEQQKKHLQLMQALRNLKDEILKETDIRYVKKQDAAVVRRHPRTVPGEA